MEQTVVEAAKATMKIQKEIVYFLAGGATGSGLTLVIQQVVKKAKELKKEKCKPYEVIKEVKAELVKEHKK